MFLVQNITLRNYDLIENISTFLKAYLADDFEYHHMLCCYKMQICGNSHVYLLFGYNQIAIIDCVKTFTILFTCIP